MKMMKKVILSLTIVFSLAIAFVIGCVGKFDNKTPASNNTTVSNPNQLEVDNSNDNNNTNDNKVVSKPDSYTFKPGEVVVQKGGNTLNYNYSPSVDQSVTPPTVAYEYIFLNPMDKATAVNLKEIDTTAVNVSYAWSTSKLDTTGNITSYTNFECQKMSNYASRAYIYILVTPTSISIPVTFTSSVIFYYGIAKDVTVENNVGATTSTQTIVSGQPIDKNTLKQPAGFTKTEGENEIEYYFDAWFLDSDYTQLATFPIASSTKLYARFHNIPFGNTQIFAYEGTPDDDTGSYRFHTSYNGFVEEYLLNSRDVIIPTIYNDGVNGEAFVTSIGGYAFYDDLLGESVSLNSISMPYTIESIGQMAFSYCVGLQNVTTLPKNLTTISSQAFAGTDLQRLDLSSCANLTTIADNVFAGSSLTDVILPSALTVIEECVFMGCVSLLNVTLPNSLTSIGNSAFYGCSGLTSITLPSSLTSIGSSTFWNCSGLKTVYNLSSLNIVKGSSGYGRVAYYADNVYTSLPE